MKNQFDMTMSHLRRAGISRAFALKFICPLCSAMANKPCIGARSPHRVRKSPHRERYEVAYQWRERNI